MYSILVADDEKDVVSLLKDYLELKGYCVYTANNGKEAIEKATEKSLEQMNKNLKEDEYIINYKILNTNIKENELELSMFFSVYENITEYQEITNENIE
mgnify:CR=1 FL=1